jgi:hypothetical protein
MVWAVPQVFCILACGTLLPVDLLACSRAVRHTSAPGAQVQPLLGAPTVGTLGRHTCHVVCSCLPWHRCLVDLGNNGRDVSHVTSVKNAISFWRLHACCTCNPPRESHTRKPPRCTRRPLADCTQTHSSLVTCRPVCCRKDELNPAKHSVTRSRVHELLTNITAF